MSTFQASKINASNYYADGGEGYLAPASGTPGQVLYRLGGPPGVGWTGVSGGGGGGAGASGAFQQPTSNGPVELVQSYGSSFNVNLHSGGAPFTTNSNAGSGSVTIGEGNTGAGGHSVAMGLKNNAQKQGSVAIGEQNSVTDLYGVAVGYKNEARWQYGVAMGHQNIVKGEASVAMGEGNYTGSVTQAPTGGEGNYSVAMGKGNTGSGEYSVAMGQNNWAGNTGTQPGGAIAIGDGNKAKGNESIAMGFQNTAGPDNGCIAMGFNNFALGAYSVAMGKGNTGEGEYSVAMGESNAASAIYSIAMGKGNTGGATGAVAIGTNCSSTNPFCVAMGYKADTNTNPSTGDFAAFALGTAFSNGGLEGNVFTIGQTGWVGINIGTNVARCPIEINNAAPQSNFGAFFTTAPHPKETILNSVQTTLAGSQEFWPYLTGDPATDPPTEDIAIYSSGGGIYAKSFIGPSDARIKENITTLDTAETLEKIRTLRPVSYTLIKDRPNPYLQYGYIAQEVKELLPQAVGLALQNEWICSEMRLSTDHSWSGVTGVTGYNAKLTIHDLEGSTGNQLYRFYVADDEEEQKKEVAAEESDPKSFLFDNSYNKVFIWGKQVNDFHTLDYTKVNTFAIPAIQELDKQLTAEKAKNAKLEARLAALEERVTTLESN